MAFLGLILLLAGVIMNIQLLRGPLRRQLPPGEFMRTPPWLVSLGLIVAGLVLVLIGLSGTR